MDTGIMLFIHRHATPLLDAAFVFSAHLGSLWLCFPLIALAAARNLYRGERREAAAWIVLAVLAAGLPELVKAVVGRPRPTLWPWLLPVSESSFPSGHAVAGAAFYPFAGWLALRSRNLGGLGYWLGLVVAAVVGVGRLYVGVHWPTDVLAGWALGGALSGGSMWWLVKGQGGEVSRSTSRSS